MYLQRTRCVSRDGELVKLNGRIFLYRTLRVLLLLDQREAITYPYDTYSAGASLMLNLYNHFRNIVDSDILSGQ